MVKQLLLFLLLASVFFTLGWFGKQYWATNTDQGLLNPFVALPNAEPEKPLLSLTIPALRQYPYQTSDITILETLSENETYTTYLFSYTTLGKKMTGQLNVPTTLANNPAVIVLIRGYVPPSTYTTGIGTSSAAEVFAQAGYITLAPDFFGFGESDPEPDDSWQSRFEKPVAVVELIKSIQNNGVQLQPDQTSLFTTDTIGVWAHSNGGQIALTTLEALSEPIPTTLWAPVTAPFPYSILFFSDEAADEGKSSRLWIAQFEKLYDVFDFSLTQHLKYLTGPLQIHQGMLDDAVPYSWNDEFVTKIDQENKQRAQLVKEIKTASESATKNETILEEITVDYFRYPGTDHNLRQSWNTAIERDLTFFETHLP